MRVLFLDFDGVLNSLAWIHSTQGKRRADESDIEFEARDISPKAVRRLNKIIVRTGAKVVVSSSWRKLHALEDLQAILKLRGFVGEIIDVTPSLWRSLEGKRLYRGDEIQAWLDAHPEVSRFAITDDESDMCHLKHRLVKTSMDKGIQDHHVERLCALLEEAHDG